MDPDEKSGGSERQLQLLAIIAQSVVNLADKLSDLTALSQQQNDLLRALLKKEVGR